MVTPQSLLIAAFIMLALALALAAVLYWTDHKGKIERAIARVIIFLVHLVATVPLTIGYLIFTLIFVFWGMIALNVRVLRGHLPAHFKVKISFDD